MIKINNDLPNFDTIKNSIINGKCLSLDKADQATNKFSLDAIDCNEKRLPICKINPTTSTVVAPSKPPKFPCLGKSKVKRKKRDLSQKDTEKDNGY